MALVRIIVIFFIVGSDASVYDIRPLTILKYEEFCRNLTEVPSFDEDKVLGTIWRVYYAWNMYPKEICMDVKFTKPTQMTIRRFHDKMHTLIENQPTWTNAKLVMTMNETREMLLLSDKDFFGPGRFIGVPNIYKSKYKRRSHEENIILYKVAGKLFQDGRYLVMSDCRLGITTFSVRRDQKHTWGEITSIVNTLSNKFGNEQGSPTCKYYEMSKLHRLGNKV